MMGQFEKGIIPWNKGLLGYNSGENNPKWKGGRPICIDCGKQLVKYGAKRCNPCASKLKRGENHAAWKGDLVSYRNLHRWVERYMGKATYCENNQNHISTRYHWANISGEYKRELTDWKSVCPSCNLSDGIKRAERFGFERRVSA